MDKRQGAHTEIREIPLQRKEVLFPLERVAWSVSFLGDILKSRLDTWSEAPCSNLPLLLSRGLGLEVSAEVSVHLS